MPSVLFTSSFISLFLLVSLIFSFSQSYLKSYLRLIILGGVSWLVIGCQNTPQAEKLDPASPNTLRAELKTLGENSINHPDQAREQLKRLIPTWQEARSLLHDPSQWDAQVEVEFNQMRATAIQELPWALDIALKSGLNTPQLHRVAFHTGFENAPGDLALLKHLKANTIYTITWRKEEDGKGFRVSGWVYESGYGWRCLLKLGEQLEKVGKKD